MASVKLSALISRLRDSNINKVSIPYEGSGDSGSADIEGVDFYFAETASLATRAETINELRESLYEELESFAYHILEKHYPWDWYNNDGGYGSVSINVQDNTVYINGYVRSVEDADESVAIEDINY